MKTLFHILILYTTLTACKENPTKPSTHNPISIEKPKSEVVEQELPKGKNSIIDKCNRLNEDENTFNLFPLDNSEKRVLDSLIHVQPKPKTKFRKLEKDEICKYDTIVNWIDRRDNTYFEVYSIINKQKNYLMAISRNRAGTGIGSSFCHMLIVDNDSGHTFETLSLIGAKEQFFFDKKEDLYYYKITFSQDWDKDWDHVILDISKRKVDFDTNDIKFH